MTRCTVMVDAVELSKRDVTDARDDGSSTAKDGEEDEGRAHDVDGNVRKERGSRANSIRRKSIFDCARV